MRSIRLNKVSHNVIKLVKLAPEPTTGLTVGLGDAGGVWGSSSGNLRKYSKAITK
jgi:hypothetical protein